MDLIQEIFRITEDKKSGSAAIVKKLQKIIYIYGSLEKTTSKKLLIDSLTTLFSKSGQFAALFHFIDRFLFWIEDKFPDTTEIVSKDIITFLEDYNFIWNNVNKLISKNLFIEVNPEKLTKVLLHSYSSTVCEVFEILKNDLNKIEIFQTISSPNGEGKLQAEYLRTLGYKVTIFVDAMVNKVAKEVDFTILGTDAVFEDFFINKIGSYNIVNSCRQLNKPVVLVCDTRKFISSNVNDNLADTFRNEIEKPDDEVWKNIPDGFKVLNYYFEEIPNKLITSIVTENSIYQPDDLIRIIQNQSPATYFK